MTSINNISYNNSYRKVANNTSAVKSFGQASTQQVATETAQKSNEHGNIKKKLLVAAGIITGAGIAVLAFVRGRTNNLKKANEMVKPFTSEAIETLENQHILDFFKNEDVIKSLKENDANIKVALNLDNENLQKVLKKLKKEDIDKILDPEKKNHIALGIYNQLTDEIVGAPHIFSFNNSNVNSRFTKTLNEKGIVTFTDP